MALAYVLLSSFAAFGSAAFVWITGGGVWSGIGAFYLAGFGTIAALILWQCRARPAQRSAVLKPAVVQN